MGTLSVVVVVCLHNGACKQTTALENISCFGIKNGNAVVQFYGLCSIFSLFYEKKYTDRWCFSISAKQHMEIVEFLKNSMHLLPTAVRLSIHFLIPFVCTYIELHFVEHNVYIVIFILHTRASHCIEQPKS